MTAPLDLSVVGVGEAPNPGAAAAGMDCPPTASQPPTEPRIVGLDLSLRSSGAASKGWTDTIGCDPTIRSYRRLRFIRDAIRELTRTASLVVVEGPSFRSTGPGHHESAGLWWLITYDLCYRYIPFVVVPPASRAKYATGKGNAPKDAVLAAVIRRFPTVDVSNNNEADALALAAMGYDHYGFPLAPMPASHRAALDAVDWPDL